jgi:hydrogenase maturation protease
MKPLLVIGLGNPLMGDEGIGWHVAERLSADPRLPAGAEAVCGGTDLLRHAAGMESRRRVIVVDALRDEAAPGTVSVWAEPGGAGAAACQPALPSLADLDTGQENAHSLSAVQAIQLLRMTLAVPITLLGVSIPHASFDTGLSPALAASLPAILDCVLREIG